MAYNVKSIRKQFAERGIFHTDRALAEMLRSFIPGDIDEVYDPTCGAGDLLAVFPDDVAKYGQEIEPDFVADAAALPNAHIATGDTLHAPAFADRRFRAIVANPPFSVKWKPMEGDPRFDAAPCLPPPSRADWAFLLHCLWMLADDGVCAALSFPGILYRGQREGRIRQWFVEQGYIHEIHAIEGGHFVDTKTETALLIIRKTPARDILFVHNATGRSRRVGIGEIHAHGFNLSINTYVDTCDAPPMPEVDPVELENTARARALRKIEAEISFSLMVADLEGYAADPFIEDIIALANKFRKQPLLFT